MLISRPVKVKSKVTPGLKAQLGAEVQKAILDLDKELQSAEGPVRKQLLQRKEDLTKRFRQVADLEDGQEIVRGQVQGIFELRVGDIWPQEETAEIILENDIVIAVREGNRFSVLTPLAPPVGGKND